MRGHADARATRRLSLALLLAVAGLLFACSKQTGAAVSAEGAADPAAQEASAAPPSPPNYAPFALKPEPAMACQRAGKIDVNLGNSPEVFVHAVYCQVTGKPATDDQVFDWSEKLRNDRMVRRIDVVKQVCLDNNRKCSLVYSDPWQEQVELSGAPEKKVKRDVGAVLMFFFNCPDNTNCTMSWANTHAHGMLEKHKLYGFGENETDYLDPLKPGFWHRELLDAQWAGLDFVMPNVYGPDIEDNKLAPLQQALDAIKDPPKIAMFDDSWTWGEPWFSDFWKQRPDLNNTEEAAQLIFNAKWKPFFGQIKKENWYRFKGRPFIYVYNAGKLNPRSKAGPLFARMKELFKAEFGEEPFLMVDSAYFDDKRMPDVADSKFQWFTFQQPGKRSHQTMNGHVIDHAMVRWDAVGREHDRPSKPGDFILKGDKILRQVLDESRESELLILATWNDLGEGTGVNRNYDYFDQGHWLAPNHFMRLIRESQSGKLLQAESGK